MKVCTKCNQEKEQSEFYRRKASKDGLGLWCKECIAVHQAEWYAKPENKVAKKAQQAEYDAKPEVKAAKRAYETEWKARPENRTARRAHDLNEKYGLSLEAYDEMLIESCGKCAICNKPFGNYIKEPAIDHNHATGEVRGLLHAKCNKALGLFNEDPTILLNAIEYLKQ